MVQEFLEIVEKYGFFHNCFLSFILFWGNMNIFIISWNKTFDGEACVNLIKKLMKVTKFSKFSEDGWKGKHLKELSH